MFFGREVKANQNKASSLTMDNDIKLSQAVLDPASKGNKKDPVTLFADVEGKSFILAVLDPSQSWQCPLDLMLAAGTKVKFYLRGQGCVHLTGYEFRDDDDFEMSMSSDEESDDAINLKGKPVAKRIKTKNSPATTNGLKPIGKPKLDVKGDNDDSEDDDDDSDDDEDLSFGSEEEDLDSSALDSDDDAMDHDFRDLNGDMDDSDSDEDDDDDDDDDKDIENDSDEEEADSDSS